MNRSSKNTDHSLRLITALAMLAVLNACAGNYGAYRANSGALQFFKAAEAPADYHYYYTGSNVQPGAILAIHKGYTLAAEDLWIKKDLAGKDFREWVDAMTRNLRRAPFAYTLTAPDGKQIGFMFTAWEPGPLVMEGEARVSVYLPDDGWDRLRQIHN